jgi:hypothetical protein
MARGAVARPVTGGAVAGPVARRPVARGSFDPVRAGMSRSRRGVRVAGRIGRRSRRRRGDRRRRRAGGGGRGDRGRSRFRRRGSGRRAGRRCRSGGGGRAGSIPWLAAAPIAVVSTRRSRDTDRRRRSNRPGGRSGALVAAGRGTPGSLGRRSGGGGRSLRRVQGSRGDEGRRAVVEGHLLRSGDRFVEGRFIRQRRRFEQRKAGLGEERDEGESRRRGQPEEGEGGAPHPFRQAGPGEAGQSNRGEKPAVEHPVHQFVDRPRRCAPRAIGSASSTIDSIIRPAGRIRLPRR